MTFVLFWSSPSKLNRCELGWTRESRHKSLFAQTRTQSQDIEIVCSCKCLGNRGLREGILAVDGVTCDPLSGQHFQVNREKYREFSQIWPCILAS